MAKYMQKYVFYVEATLLSPNYKISHLEIVNSFSFIAKQ